MAFLEIKQLSKRYPGAAVPVLSNIDLAIDKGEFVAVVGYSGAGKTTLISLLAGLIKPDAGCISLNDLEIAAPGPDRGVVFQNYSLLPWLSAFENIYLAVDQAFPNWASTRKSQHTARYLELVNLTTAAQKRPSELSGGMRQRVALARALAMEPQILLLDEPLSALDALTRATLQDEISRIRQATNMTVVLITNDPDEGIYLADRIIPLTAGPQATLGPSFAVSIPRPRDRKALNHDPHFKQLRRDVSEFLLHSRRERHATVTRKLTLPDIAPEDLSLPRRHSRPVRRREEKRETVEVGS
ncbi:MAG: ABC transporter ATP-binding protein [Verrucomicrobiota bacterium]